MTNNEDIQALENVNRELGYYIKESNANFDRLYNLINELIEKYKKLQIDYLLLAEQINNSEDNYVDKN